MEQEPWLRALTVLVFAVTWLLIAARRLRWLPIGRPAGALLGAVAMVGIGALSPREAYGALDHDTLVLLFATMLLSAYVERAGLFERLGRAAMAVAPTPVALLVLVSMCSGAASALFVNDTVCLFLTPLVVGLCTRARLPLGPYLIAVCTGANLGSAATLVGNPQNMIIGSLSGLSFLRFLALVGPAALVALVGNALLLVLWYGRRLPRAFARDAEPLPVGAAGRGQGRVLAVLAALLVAFLAGAHLGFAALGAVVVLVLLDREDPHLAFARVDWPLLVFFAALFVVVEGVVRTGFVQQAFEVLGPSIHTGEAAGAANFSAFAVLGSNVFSNVPFVLLAGPYVPGLGPAELTWALLAFVCTAAGNLTLLGSVANLIVAERARPHHDLSFFEYLRFGLPSTVIVLLAATPVLWFTAAWLAN